MLLIYVFIIHIPTSQCYAELVVENRHLVVQVLQLFMFFTCFFQMTAAVRIIRMKFGWPPVVHVSKISAPNGFADRCGVGKYAESKKSWLS